VSDLLPQNATEFERGMADAAARISAVPPNVRDVWNPATCPEPLLPWLAWAFSVDSWDPRWSDAQKRETIRRAIEVQRIKGTIGAVRRALGAIDIEAAVLEWHRQETPGDPFTYRLLIDATSNAATIEEIFEAVEIVDAVKSLRSHMEVIEVSTNTRAGPIVAAAASIGSEIVVRYRGEALNQGGEWDDTLVWDDTKSWGLEL
jgi:phage tail P2-like protein